HVLSCSLCALFFSSRRRHTSSKRDWSSDVCSSDLTPIEPSSLTLKMASNSLDCNISSATDKALSLSCSPFCVSTISISEFSSIRSEERRVGQEVRCRRKDH